MKVLHLLSREAAKQRASGARKAAENARKNLTRAESDIAKFRQRITRDTERLVKLSEGFRKVRLKQGVNRVLFRVENGHSQSEFSLAVCGQ